MTVPHAHFGLNAGTQGISRDFVDSLTPACFHLSSTARCVRLMSTPETKTATAEAADTEPQLRDLLSFSAGGITFGVFADAVEGTAESRRPAPLPFAPAAVLGVVSIRGRMLTTLDPVGLVTGEPLNWPLDLPHVIALRGDEQLGLAAENLGETITIATADVQPAGPTSADQNSSVIEGISRHAGHEITILNVENLFAAAVQRRERRRRRF
jgi:purine-binding chemotaxis protein CheW